MQDESTEKQLYFKTVTALSLANYFIMRGIKVSGMKNMDAKTCSASFVFAADSQEELDRIEMDWLSSESKRFDETQKSTKALIRREGAK